MEFDELKKIWDSQNNQTMYAINEQALYSRILSKKRASLHITNVSELLLIVVNFGSGCFILGMNLLTHSGNAFIYLLSAWMLISALYLTASRIRRVKEDRKFDRSLLGDLHHALAVATYQVRLSQLMRWNMLPVGALILLGLADVGKSFGVMGAILCAVMVVYYASAWEHSYYKSRRRELEILQSKLEMPEQGKL